MYVLRAKVFERTSFYKTIATWSMLKENIIYVILFCQVKTSIKGFWTPSCFTQGLLTELPRMKMEEGTMTSGR